MFSLRGSPNIPENEVVPDSKAPVRISIQTVLEGIPAIVIGSILNLMLCVPFGLSIFPPTWQLPFPRAIGVQMFLLSTAIAQISLSFYSGFPCAMGMMMVGAKYCFT